MRITTNGFVVHKQDLNDFDILVTLFSQEHGLLKAVAQRAKKKPQLLAQLELFQEAAFIINRTEALGVIYQVDPIAFLPGIRDSYDSYMLASHFTIVTRTLLPFDMPHAALYSIYRQYLFLLSDNAYNSKQICLDFYGDVLYAEGLAIEKKPIAKARFRQIIYEYCGVTLE